MVLVLSQVLFTFTALWAKYHLSGTESFISEIKGWWLIVYVVVYHIATFLQLYVFKMTNIFKATALFSCLSLMLTVGAGYFLLNEVLDWRDILSIVLVICALGIIHSENVQTGEK